jgi:hypothetical protein
MYSGELSTRKAAGNDGYSVSMPENTRETPLVPEDEFFTTRNEREKEGGKTYCMEHMTR